MNGVTDRAQESCQFICLLRNSTRFRMLWRATHSISLDSLTQRDALNHSKQKHSNRLKHACGWGGHAQTCSHGIPRCSDDCVSNSIPRRRPCTLQPRDHPFLEGSSHSRNARLCLSSLASKPTSSHLRAQHRRVVDVGGLTTSARGEHDDGTAMHYPSMWPVTYALPTCTMLQERERELGESVGAGLWPRSAEYSIFHRIKYHY